MDIELQKKLVKKYPTVFKEYGGDMRHTCMAWGICCGNGWYDILDELCAILEPLGIVAAQVKEKFGGLRFYVGAIPSEHWDEVYNVIRAAESKSQVTCEDCGKSGQIDHADMWLKAICDKCRKKGRYNLVS